MSSASVPEMKSLSLKRTSWLTIAVAFLLIVSGFLAIILPVEMSVGVVIVLCWLLIISAIAQVFDAFRGSGAWHKIWKILTALAYLVTGIYLRFNLGIGLVALHLALILFFVVQGLVDIVVYLRVRRLGRQGWLLMHGIVTLILGLMIWRHWPSGTLWVIGTLVGIGMIMTGVARLSMAVAGRRAARMISQVVS